MKHGRSFQSFVALITLNAVHILYHSYAKKHYPDHYIDTRPSKTCPSIPFKRVRDGEKCSWVLTSILLIITTLNDDYDQLFQKDVDSIEYLGT